jgi:hypothetical protein
VEDRQGTEALALTGLELKNGDIIFDPTTPLTLNLWAASQASGSQQHLALDEVPALFLGLLGRTEPRLAPYEERVLRACLCLTGERLSVSGGLDTDFYEALLAFKVRHHLHPIDARLDLPSLTMIVQAASRAVGAGPGFFLRRLRGVWFDVMWAPALIAEAPGIVNLVRELKGGRTRAPVLKPLQFQTETAALTEQTGFTPVA